MKNHKWLLLLILVLLLLFTGSFTYCAPVYTPTQPTSPTTANVSPPREESTNSFTEAQVVKVVDGDTIKVAFGGNTYTVRYIGIDTPETVHPQKPVEYFGKEASEKNRELVEGKIVRLEKDVSETDKYGRLLRYVWVGDVMVNAELVRLGYAQAVTYPPDVKYQDLFLQLQREAKATGLGLWAETSQ